MVSALFTSLLPAFVAVGAIAVDTGPTTGSLGNATVVENNPPGVQYVATLPAEAFDKNAFPNGGNVVGTVTAEATDDGIGVKFDVKFSNLPPNATGFLYHIHVAPVPADGNCTQTLAHLDPFVRGEKPACDDSLPQTCQVGDLSGKYGKITSDPFEDSYVDLFASTMDGIGAFFGNRSLVVHFPNVTRITCANFERVEGSGGDSCSKTLSTTSATAVTTMAPNSTASRTPRPTATPVTVSEGASARTTGLVTLMVAVAAAIFAL